MESGIANETLGEAIPLVRTESDSADVARALRRARESLAALQREDGHFYGVLEGDSILESEYVLLFAFLGLDKDPRGPRLAARLRALQQPEGGWGIYPGAPPDPSATVKAYFALKLLGDRPEAEHMVRARGVALELGGIEAVNSFTRFYLALLGQLDWDKCPSVPPELVMLPHWSYLSIWAFSSWSRAIVVPLTILWALRPVRPVPKELCIPELSTGRPLPGPTRPGAGPVENGWRTFFHELDGALRRAEDVGAFRRTRRAALQKAEAWMMERLQLSDGLGAIFPSMVYSVMALSALGHGPQSRVLRQQLHELERLELPAGDALRVQPCTSPVWDTAIAASSLLASGTPGSDASLTRAASWLLDKEVRRAGDWSLRTKAEVGGWYFEYANEFYPDCDDTAQVLIALASLELADSKLDDRVQAARRRGLQWLLAMQNSNGGWAAFDRDCDRQVLTYVPFADHNAMLDPSCPDITGRVLCALARSGIEPSHRAVRRAVRFLEAHQEEDGSFYGRWGCNYLYGTWLALTGLRASGYDMRRRNVERAAEWIRAHQNADGGWGESLRTYDEPSLRGQGASTAAQTAWALMGLFAAGDRTSRAVHRGVAHLLRTQGGDGTWHDEPWTGTGFPRVFYLRYDLYDDYFPVMALGQYAGAEEGEEGR